MKNFILLLTIAYIINISYGDIGFYNRLQYINFKKFKISETFKFNENMYIYNRFNETMIMGNTNNLSADCEATEYACIWEELECKWRFNCKLNYDGADKNLLKCDVSYKTPNEYLRDLREDDYFYNYEYDSQIYKLTFGKLKGENEEDYYLEDSLFLKCYIPVTIDQNGNRISSFSLLTDTFNYIKNLFI